MTIRDLAKFVESLPDWAMLDGCFGAGIRPSDIDGWVERNGICLFLEHKLPGVPVSRGQNRGFRSLAAQGNTVIVFWGRADDGSDLEHLMVHEAGRITRKVAATLADLRAEAAAWYQRAEDDGASPRIGWPKATRPGVWDAEEDERTDLLPEFEEGT